MTPPQCSPAGIVAGDDAAGLDLGALADDRAGCEQRAREPMRAPGADPDLADDELVAVDPPAAQVDLRLNGRTRADVQRATRGRARVASRAPLPTSAPISRA